MTIAQIALVVGFTVIAVYAAAVIVRWLDRWLPMDEDE